MRIERASFIHPRSFIQQRMSRVRASGWCGALVAMACVGCAAQTGEGEGEVAKQATSPLTVRQFERAACSDSVKKLAFEFFTATHAVLCDDLVQSDTFRGTTGATQPFDNSLATLQQTLVNMQTRANQQLSSTEPQATRANTWLGVLSISIESSNRLLNELSQGWQVDVDPTQHAAYIRRIKLSVAEPSLVPAAHRNVVGRALTSSQAQKASSVSVFGITFSLGGNITLRAGTTGQYYRPQSVDVTLSTAMLDPNDTCDGKPVTFKECNPDVARPPAVRIATKPEGVQDL